MNRILRYSGVLVFLLCFSVFSTAQSDSPAGSLIGTISNEADGALVPGVSIEIVQLRRSVVSDETGNYVIRDVPNGSYTVVTHLEGYSDKAQRITIKGVEVRLDFALSLASVNAEVTVTATGEEQSIYESFSSVTSVNISKINEKASTSIGEVLDNEPGVTKRSFGGGGSSRPSIRGFEGDRVLILQDGVRNGSIGAASGDHGEPISPFNLERLEVIKGPATLLYGSNAIGGVVNAVSDDENNAHPGVRGYFTGFGGSVNRQFGGAAGVEIGFKKFLLDIDLNKAREGDVETPFGRIPNSASRSYGGSTSIGYFGKYAFVRGSFNLDRRRYGIPYAPLFESGAILDIANGGIDCGVGAERLGDEPDCQFNIEAIKEAFSETLPPLPEEEIDVRMRRNNYRLKGGFRDLRGLLESGNFSIDFTDYQHEEIEAADGVETVATTFFNDVFSYRGVVSQKKYKKLSGQIGAEGFRRSYLTVGAESLIDGRVRQHMFGAFSLQQVSLEKVALQFGARVESNRYRPTNGVLEDKDFTGFSGAVGVRYEAWKGGSLVFNYASSYRPPALEELYNFGPHIGTVTFEIGNPLLGRERSNGVEFSLRQQSKRIRFNGSVFYDNISDFVFLSPRDEDLNGQTDVADGLPISFYAQNDVRFFGADGSFEVDVNDYVGFYFIGDVVSAKLTGNGLPLPRISPARGRIGSTLKYGGLSVRPELIFVAAKNTGSVFPLETTTAGYALFNINGSYSFVTKNAFHIITFGGQNLSDKLYRTHTNFIKDLTPEPGRGFKVSYTLRFY